MSGCLDGIKVLELARYQAGPRAGMVMSDMGAEVIKVEKPGGEETRAHAPLVNGTSVYFTVYNRGKKSITLNMRTEEGKEIFRELVKTADVVLENFRPGVIAKMGFSYEELKKIKPDIILTSVSGFGPVRPIQKPARLRPHRPGDVRADGDHRSPRRPPGPHRFPHHRPHNIPPRLHRHPGGGHSSQRYRRGSGDRRKPAGHGRDPYGNSHLPPHGHRSRA